MPSTHPLLSTAHRSSWGMRAIASGIAASALAAGLATTTYLGIDGTAALPWDRLGPAILLFALVTGVCVGALVGGATVCATPRNGRRASILRMAIATAIGGAFAGVLPGLFGIAGFGSLHAPYLGSLNILSCVLAGATAFVVLWAPRLLSPGVAAKISPARRFSLSALAAVITMGSAGLLGGVFAMSLRLVPTLGSLQCIELFVGLPALAIGGGVLLGAMGGALVGLCCGVFVTLAAKTVRHPRR